MKKHYSEPNQEVKITESSINARRLQELNILLSDERDRNKINSILKQLAKIYNHNYQH